MAGVKKAIQGGSAVIHSPSHLGFGEVLLFHGGFELAGEPRLMAAVLTSS